MKRVKTAEDYALAALRSAAWEMDKGARLLLSMGRKRRTNATAAGFYRVGSARTDAALRLWALAAEMRRARQGGAS